MIHLRYPEGPVCPSRVPSYTTVRPVPLQGRLDCNSAQMCNSLRLNEIGLMPQFALRGVQVGAEFAFYRYGSSWYRHIAGKGGGWMIKALFTMILLSNEHAARLVERFQRLRA